MSESSGRLREYFSRRGYAEHVVEGGLLGLVETWESTARAVASGEPQTYYEYLNDVDGRRILQEGLELLGSEADIGLRRRVVSADALIKGYLIPTQVCVWGQDVARDRGYSPEHDWWYFHRPRHVDSSWPSDSRYEKVPRFLSRLAVVSLAFAVLFFGAASLNIGMKAEFGDKYPHIGSLTLFLGCAAVFFLVLSARVWFPLPDRTFGAIALRTLAFLTFASLAALFAYVCLFNATVRLLAGAPINALHFC
jgi:hypothetical protein